MKSFKAHISKTQGEIYCDMDGVLADLMGWFCKTYSPPSCKSPAIDHYFEAAKPDILVNHPNLYAELPWTKDGKQLWTYIGKHNPNILSAYSRFFVGSIADKHAWIAKHLSPVPNAKHLVLRKDKKLHATQKDGTPNILIDDWVANIREWKAAGGIAIHHKDTSSTIAQLKKLGYK